MLRSRAITASVPAGRLWRTSAAMQRQVSSNSCIHLSHRYLSVLDPDSVSPRIDAFDQRPVEQLSQNLEKEVNFSIDLVSAAEQHMIFLRDIHLTGVTLLHRSSGSLPKESLRRYRDLWLPMIHQQVASQTHYFVPPADVAWMWHCHRLAPHHYRHYIESRFQAKRFDASPTFAFQLPRTEDVDDASYEKGHPQNRNFDWNPLFASNEGQQASRTATSALVLQTRHLWEKIYPNEPFHLFCSSLYMKYEHHHPWQQQEQNSNKNSLRLGGQHDKLGSAKTASLLSFICIPPSIFEYLSRLFLEDGMTRYRQFLQLRAHASRDQILVPTYQIDFLWHTHMLASSTTYHDDCRRYLNGFVLPHDDGIGADRT